MKTKFKLISLVIAGLVVSGCGGGGEQNAATRAAQVAEEMGPGYLQTMNIPGDPAVKAWNRVVTLSQEAQEKADATLAAGNAGDMHGFLTLRTEAMLAHRQAAQAWETAQNHSEGASESLRMSAQEAWQAAAASWNEVQNYDAMM